MAKRKTSKKKPSAFGLPELYTPEAEAVEPIATEGGSLPEMLESSGVAPGKVEDERPISGPPRYRVSTPRAKGFCRIGRRFTREPVELLKSDLSEAEIEILEARPAFLFIEKLDF